MRRLINDNVTTRCVKVGHIDVEESKGSPRHPEQRLCQDPGIRQCIDIPPDSQVSPAVAAFMTHA
jgi:hypothetical protein